MRADESDPRLWLQNAPVCPALAVHHIAHTGVMRAGPRFAVVRIWQSGTYFFHTRSGVGRVLIDGRWQLCPPGHCCLLPPHMLNAFESAEERWEFAWVRYKEPPHLQPILSASSPVLQKFNGEPFQHAVRGLLAEFEGADSPAHPPQWVELIHSAVLRFSDPWRGDERLRALWQKVEQELDSPWTVPMLARTACLSREHLRRLCQQELGRSPMQHVTWLRMRRATELLSRTNDTIAAIASEVGYDNPFAFSNTFTKWIGWRPSHHRNPGGAGAGSQPS